MTFSVAFDILSDGVMDMAKRPTKEQLYQKALVAKRNVLNEIRSTSMTVQELRFFSIYLSKINPWDVSTRRVRFPIEDFQRIMEFGRLNIKQLKATTNSLLCKVVNLPTETGGYIGFQLFKECKVDQGKDGRWYMEIDAHDRALPLMFEFKNRYFKYELWNALRLKSPNQVRMYEILKQYEGVGHRELSVQSLRDLLGIAPTEYAGRTGWTDFKKYVLDACQQALKESTDICYTYERGQTGRGGKWLSVVFHISRNGEYIDQLTLDEFIEQQPNPGVIIDADESDYSEVLPAPAYDDRLDLLSDACKNEFSPAELEQLLEIIVTIPEWKLPPDTAAGGSIDLRRYHYLAERYATMNRYKPKDNRLNYLVKLLKADANTD